MEGDQFDPPVGTHQFVTVQPDGIPLVPVFHEVIDGSFTNVPDPATPETQLVVQPEAEMSVARHFMYASLLQP